MEHIVRDRPHPCRGVTGVIHGIFNSQIIFTASKQLVAGTTTVEGSRPGITSVIGLRGKGK